MSLRESVGQASWSFRASGGIANLRTQARVIRRIDLPRLPAGPRRAGEVWGVTVVRNELDVLETSIRHLFGQGIDHVLVADNMSTDGTREMLRSWATHEPRLHVALDREPAHVQSQKMTWLANRAWRSGADWIVPFDADEFWFATDRSVAEELRGQDVGIVHAAFHHMVPTSAHPRDLTSADFVLDSTSSFPGKVALRSHALAWIGPGNHQAARIGGESTGLAIAHAQYRGPAQVARKVRQGIVAARLTGEDMSWFVPHWERGAELSDAQIDEVWANISAGLPDERLDYRAIGPMVTVRPVGWTTWDPDGVIRSAQARGRDAADDAAAP